MALWSFGFPVSQQEVLLSRTRTMNMLRLSTQAVECITSLQHCHAICLSIAMTSGLEERIGPQHIRLMMDCAAACSFAADLIARKSQFHTEVCRLCADICDTCAQDCDQLGDLDQCAAVCRDASAQSRELARPQKAEIMEMAARLPPSP